MKLTVVLAVLVGTLVLACSSAAPAPNATAISEPTSLPNATAIPEPTSLSTATAIPEPTAIATSTPVPPPTLTPTPNAWMLGIGAAAKLQEEEARLDEEATDWFDLGVSSYQSGLYEDAITNFNKAIEISPRVTSLFAAYSHSIYDIYGIYHWRGYSYQRLGQYIKAVEDYTKEIEFFIPSAGTYVNRASSYRELGEYANADSDQTKACSLDKQYCPAPTPTPTIVWEGLKGYLQGYAYSGQSDHGYGLSYYTGIWSTFEDYQLDYYQRGHGTWITPDNTEYEQPLCPVGTVARDNWPERGPSYRDVFQTIEGGPGYWSGSTRFPDRQMKYRLNAVTDCYSTQTSSTGWNWGGTSNLENQAGFVQLSNRLLYPPDGMTFKRGIDGKFLGQAWMTLPLTLGHSQTSTAGTNNWTLFLNAANYSGPTVYMPPEGWNRITDGYAPAEGRGLDTLFTNSTFRSLADEIGQIRSYETSKNGQTYSRIPRMKYPVDTNQRTIFHQDVKFYSSDAIHDSIATHIQIGSALSSGRLDSQGTVDANITSADFGFRQNGKSIRGLENIVQTQTFGGTAWGFNWIDENSLGVFPEYFVGSDEDDYRTVISEAEVPTWTGLLDVVMPLKSMDSNRMYEPPREGWPRPEGNQTYSVDLIDGSTVTYGWYKFIDQPSILKLNLNSAQRTKLQSLVETIHTLNWGTSNPVLAPPTFGDLVEIDDALLLTPPAGMNIGYVPVALRQHKD